MGGGGGLLLHLPSAVVLPARKIPEDGLRVGVWGLGFGVWGLGFGVWGLGFGVWGLGCGVWGSGCGVGILVVPVNEKHIGSDL